MNKKLQLMLLMCIVPLMSYAYTQDYTFTFDPPSGQVSSLGGGVGGGSGIVIYCDKGITYAGNSSLCMSITVEDEQGNTKLTSTLLQGSQLKEYCTIMFTSSITDDGVYTLKIPAGVAILDPDGLAEENEAMEVEYYIGDKEVIELTTTPADGSRDTTGPLTSINVSTEDVRGMTIDESADLSQITVVKYFYNTPDEVVACCTGYTLAEDGSYNLTLDEPINTSYDYYFTIPYKLFSATSDKTGETIYNDATTVKFWLSAGKEIEFAFASPDVTMATVSEVVLAATGATEVAAEDVSGLTVTDDNGVSVACSGVTIGEADDDGTYPITCTLASELTDAGTYTVTIPEGFFYIYENKAATNDEEITSTFTIAGIETAPADGATIIGNLNEITLTSNAQFVLSADDVGDAMIVSDAGDVNNADLYATCEKCDISDDGLTCTLTFDAKVTDSPCALYIPEGYFTFMDEDFIATYTIKEPRRTTDFTFVPADESVLAEGVSEIQISAEGWFDLAAESAESITVTDAEGTTIATGSELTWGDQGEEATSCTISLSETITDAGAYTINIPEGFFFNSPDDETLTSDALTATFTIADLTLTFDPDGGTIESLSEIIVAYEGGIARNRKSSASDITLTSEDDATVISATSCEPDEANLNDNGDYTRFVITFTEPEDSGEYTLYIPADFFSLTLDSDNFIYANNEEVSVVYTLELPVPEGINGVNADIFDDAEIYTTTGQRVNTPVRGQVNIVRKSDGSVKNVFVK